MNLVLNIYKSTIVPTNKTYSFVIPGEDPVSSLSRIDSCIRRNDNFNFLNKAIINYFILNISHLS